MQYRRLTSTAPRIVLALLGALSCTLLMAPATSAQTPVRVGYWASGVSAGIGYVLEDGKFLEKQGLKPEWVHFTKLAEVNRALISRSIDIAVAGGTVPTLRLGAQGVPAKVILANIIADANFVVLDTSPIRTLDDLKGKKIGSTPPGSTAYALVQTVLAKNHGLAPNQYQQIPSGEAQLSIFLQQGEIDAALMRTITYRRVGDNPKLRILSSIPKEWREMLKSDAPPVLGVAVIDEAFSKAHPDVAEQYVLAEMKATKWGGAHPGDVAAILSRRLHMKPNEAKAYADSWNDIYFASLEESDIKSLLTMAEIFKTVQKFPGNVTRDLFMTAPYEKAKKALAAGK